MPNIVLTRIDKMCIRDSIIDVEYSEREEEE